MWLTTQLGFYSTTLSREEPHLVQWRGRKLEDIERLVEFASMVGLHPVKVLETPLADYQWRALFEREASVQLAGDLVRTLNYSNFKGRVAELGQSGRAALLSRVWGTMLELERASAGDAEPTSRGLLSLGFIDPQLI